MKQKIFKLSFLSLLLSFLIICNQNLIYAKTKKAPKLSKTSITLQVGQSKKLSVKNTKKKIKWSSSNKKIAIVSKNGKVTAKKIGKATITAKTGKKKLRCKITVKKRPYRYIHHSTAYYKNRRNEIYKELGINKSMKPQYICFLLAKWECDNVEYSDKDSDTISYYKKHDLDFSDWKQDDLGQSYQQALDMKTAVCGGYSKLYKFLLDGVGIENKAYRNSIHAWNHVKIDGKWYAVDVTCMDQACSIPDCNNDEGVRYEMNCFLIPDKYAPFNCNTDGTISTTLANDYRFFNTIYEAFLAYANAHPDEEDIIPKCWDKNGNFHGSIGDYVSPDYRYNPWFTGTWVNY